VDWNLLIALDQRWFAIELYDGQYYSCFTISFNIVG